MQLLGMNVITSPLLEPAPKLALSESCPCSKEVREEFNQWLLDRFGRGEAKVLFLDGDDTIVMAPSHAATLRKELMDLHPLFRMADQVIGPMGGLFRGF